MHLVRLKTDHMLVVKKYTSYCQQHTAIKWQILKYRAEWEGKLVVVIKPYPECFHKKTSPAR